MTLVGIPVEEQDAVWQLVAVVLHLGNLDFREGEEQDSSVVSEPAVEHLDAAARLLGTQSDVLSKALTTRTRQTRDGKLDSCASEGTQGHALGRCKLDVIWLMPTCHTGQM